MLCLRCTRLAIYLPLINPTELICSTCSDGLNSLVVAPIQLFCSLWEAGVPGLAMGMREKNGFAGELCIVFVGGKEERNTLARVSVPGTGEIIGDGVRGSAWLHVLCG